MQSLDFLPVELVVTVSSLRPNLSLTPHLEPSADLGSEDLSCNLDAVAAFDRETQILRAGYPPP